MDWQRAHHGAMTADTPYTHGHHESVLRSHRWRTAENSARYLVPHLVAGTSVLDVGCGPGTITTEFAHLVAPGRVVGVDQAEVVIDIARNDAAGAPVEFRTGDVMALPFDDGSFDIVHAHQLLQHLPDPVGALREMARVCAPGGIVAARECDFAAMTWFPADPGLDEWLALYERVARANRTEPDAGRRVHAWARAAGMSEITATATTWCYATPADREWWSSLWAERMVASEVARRAVELDFASPSDLERIAAAWRRWGASTDGWFAVLNGEIIARKTSPG
jgi:ubiquinone/menaquinone biosynthesis C-methylase UbiE